MKRVTKIVMDEKEFYIAIVFNTKFLVKKINGKLCVIKKL